jgi:hypothetical protein
VPDSSVASDGSRLAATCVVCADREDVRLKPAGQHVRTGPACDRIVAGTAIDSGVTALIATASGIALAVSAGGSNSGRHENIQAGFSVRR